MLISQGIIKISSSIDKEPTDIEIIGLNIDSYVTLKYKINDVIHYTQFIPSKRYEQYIFFEYLNHSPLWSCNLSSKKEVPINGGMGYGNSNNHIYFQIKYEINIEADLINDYIQTSLALNYLVSDTYNTSRDFTNTDFTNKSLIPYCEPVTPPKDFKMKLYDYQQRTLSKMLQIERNQTQFTVNYTYNINFKGSEILFDPISNSRVDKDKHFSITTKGGVLSDEMGLGKTISSIALIASHPAPKDLPYCVDSFITGCKKISSRATIVLCPSHLTKQWESEIKRCNPNFKVLTILTKTSYNGLTFGDFMDYDIIITSHQFIMNFKFYPTLHYQTCTAASYNFDSRNTCIKQYLQDKMGKISQKEMKELSNPIFEFFHFHRLILDEGHEIFGEMLENNALSKYMSRWVSNIDANYYWYVSGTPFVNYSGVKNCARFINLKLEDKSRGLVFDYGADSNTNANSYGSTNKPLSSVMRFMNKEYVWNNILDKICVRHRKCDVENQIQIPGYTERLIWLRFTDLERQLYDAKKGKVSDQYLQQLCCHPLVVESAKKIFGDVEVDLSLMQDKLIEHHKHNYEVYKVKLSKLDPTNQAYHMLKKSFETQMSESKYLVTILERMKSPEILENETCSICMDALDNPTLTACGHIFCYECLKMCLGDKKNCPMCKTNIQGKDLLVMNLKKDGPKEELNPLIKKYGSKLGKLVSIIRHLVAQEHTRIIVFSQWDDMLSLVGKTLAENDIENCFVKGNVWSRNAAIRKFKDGKNTEGVDNKVIMLSLKNAASGTNLTEATHIFFVEPINATKEECKAIEGQAIARACRVGQKQQIMLMRILIEKSIEEDIYRKNYNNDVVVSFDEQEYSVPQPKPKIANPDADGEPMTDTSETTEKSDPNIKLKNQKKELRKKEELRKKL